MRRKQTVVALSTKEVEYIVATHASKKVVWMQQLCIDIGFGQQYVRLICDIQSAILLEKNPTYHSKTKHIDVKYLYEGDNRKR